MVAPGVAVREVMPPGRAWKLLWEAQRVQMIEFPPRTGLPKGLRVVNVYAPVSTWSGEGGDLQRVWFQELFLEAVLGFRLGDPHVVRWGLEWNHQPGERLWGARVGGAGMPDVSEVVGAGGTVGGSCGHFPGLVGLDISEGECDVEM